MAEYINHRLVNLEAGKAWLDIGRVLAELKASITKTGRKNDSSGRDGWYAIFKKAPCPLPFARRRAEDLIIVHESLKGTTGAYLKTLPASARALIAIAKLPARGCRA
jgi:hypothetical protein